MTLSYEPGTRFNKYLHQVSSTKENHQKQDSSIKQCPSPGSWVLIRNQPQKFSNYIKAQVIRQLGTHILEVQLPDGRRNVHIDQIRTYPTSNNPLTTSEDLWWTMNQEKMLVIILRC